MTQKSVSLATFCTKCDSAYHKGCIKRCRINADGSVVECCGEQLASSYSYNLPQNHNTSQIQNFTSQDVFNNSYLQPTNKNQDLSNNQLNNILGGKLDQIAKNLASFNMRITKNENDITNIKNSISQIQKQIRNPKSDSQDDIVTKILSEQEERDKKARNIIVFNLPEFNKEVPKKDDEKKEFFKDLTKFNLNSVNSILETLDPTINKPVYTKRIGKYQTDKIRPLLLSFESIGDIKTIFKNIHNLKTSCSLKNVIIKHDLTHKQITTIKNMKSKCAEMNSKTSNSDFYWGIAHTNTNPKIVKLSKNKQQVTLAQKT